MIYWFSLDKVCGHKFGVRSFELACIWKFRNWRNNLKKKNLKKKILIFFTVLKVRRPGRKTSTFRTVRILKILRTSGPDMMSGRALPCPLQFSIVQCSAACTLIIYFGALIHPLYPTHNPAEAISNLTRWPQIAYDLTCCRMHIRFLQTLSDAKCVENMSILMLPSNYMWLEFTVMRNYRPKKKPSSVTTVTKCFIAEDIWMSI